jgi:hypothetical protein
MKPNGYILHEDPYRVAIVTGFSVPSDNRKTGPMVQVWILVKKENPITAVQSGTDRLICGSCPHRGNQGQNRSCYVNVGQAPLGIWRAWQSGAYPVLPSPEIFRGHYVRLGAYGDPTHIPFKLAEAIANYAAGHTGYTHQWRKPTNQPWRDLVMASVDSTQEMHIAREMGWGTFRVAKDHDHHKGETLCLSEAKGKTCLECQLCNGRKTSIYIPVHGSGAVHFTERN